MDTSKTYNSAVAAARDFFGPRNGDASASAWMKEWKELSEADKAEIATGLVANGYQIA